LVEEIDKGGSRRKFLKGRDPLGHALGNCCQERE